MTYNYNTDDISSEHEITYEKISDDDDIYLIRTEHKTYELHRKKLLKSLRLLHEHVHVPITQLQTNVSDRFNSTVESIRILYNSKSLKDLILADIRDIYANVKNPIIGTVGAFFVGCFHDDIFTGPLGCNPRCVASSLNCEMGFDCADAVFIYDNTFKQLNNKTSDNAYIYIKDYEFKNFSHHDINTLYNAGIKSYILIFSNQDGSYRKVTKKIYIQHNDDEMNNNQIALIILILIFIALILGMFFYAFKNNYIQL